MSVKRPHTVVGIFGSRDDANRGVNRLFTVGFKPEDTGMVETEDGMTLVSAEVASAERGTIAAASLLASRAVEVESRIVNPRRRLRQSAASKEAA